MDNTNKTVTKVDEKKDARQETDKTTVTRVDEKKETAKHKETSAYFVALVAQAEAKLDWKSAAQYGQKAWEMSPRNLSIVHNCIWYLIQNNQFDEAIKACDKALDLSPESETTYRYRAIANRGLGLFNEALLDHTKHLYEQSRGFASRALTFEAMGEFELALEDWEESAKTDPKRRGEEARVRVILEDYDGAMVLYRQLLKKADTIQDIALYRKILKLCRDKMAKREVNRNPSPESHKSDIGVDILRRILEQLKLDKLPLSESPKEDAKKVDPPKEDVKKVEPPKEDAPRVEPPKKVEPTKVEPTKVEPPNIEPPKEDTKKVEPAKVGSPKEDAKKVEPPTIDTFRVDATEDKSKNEDAEWEAVPLQAS